MKLNWEGFKTGSRHRDYFVIILKETLSRQLFLTCSKFSDTGTRPCDSSEYSENPPNVLRYFGNSPREWPSYFVANSWVELLGISQMYRGINVPFKRTTSINRLTSSPAYYASSCVTFKLLSRYLYRLSCPSYGRPNWDAEIDVL